MLSDLLVITSSALSVSDKINISLKGTIAGMGIVVVSLIIISIIIDWFKYLNKKPKKVEVDPVVVEEAAAEENMSDDFELVAVITAAIASSLDTTSDKLQIKSLKRVNNGRSAWISNSNSIR